MKFFFMTVLIVTTSSATASSKALSKRTWLINGEKIEMVRSKNGLIHHSTNCLKKKSCLALLAQKKAPSIELQQKDLNGGKPPGSVLCLRLGGINVIAKSKKGDISFCRFEDMSYTESATLNIGQYH